MYHAVFEGLPLGRSYRALKGIKEYTPALVTAYVSVSSSFLFVFVIHVFIVLSFSIYYVVSTFVFCSFSTTQKSNRCSIVTLTLQMEMTMHRNGPKTG